MKANKTLLIFLVAIAISNLSFSQHTYGEWVKNIVSHENSSFNNMLTDGESVIVNGYWFLDAVYDDLELPYHVGSNGLILKKDLEGNTLWHSTLTGDNLDIFFDMTLDSENNIIAVGWSSSNEYIEINGDTIYEPNMEWTSRGIVAKFSGTDGSLMWFKIINPDNEYHDLSLNEVTVDADDNIYIAGYANTDFEIEGTEFPYTQEGWGSLTFLAKLDTEGSLAWGKQFHFVEQGNAGWSISKSLAIKDEQIYFAFQYSKPVNAGEEVLPYQGDGSFDWIGLVKLSTLDGQVLKTNAYGSSSDQNIASMEFDNDGNILIAGFFTSASGFEINGVTPTSYGVEDGYVAKLNNEFELIWLKSMGSEFSSRCFNLSVSRENRIFVGGGFDSYTPLYFEGRHLINGESPANSLAMFQLVMDEDGEFEKAFALHGKDIYSIVEYKDAVLLENDIVMAAGASMDYVNFVEEEEFYSDHWAGFFMKWDLSKKFYKVYFDIKDQDENFLENAIVTLEGTSNPYNKHSFYQIDTGVYNYTVSLDGFETIEGTVEVTDQDVTVNIAMPLKSYEVSFDIRDENENPLENAIITLASTPNNANQYTFSNIFPGLHSYSVSLEGYLTSAGEFEIVNQNLTIPVIMVADYTSVDNPLSTSVKMYPNPANSHIFIDADDLIKEIEITNILGSLVYKQIPGSISTQINTGKLTPGFYLVRIATAKGTATKRLQIAD